MVKPNDSSLVWAKGEPDGLVARVNKRTREGMEEAQYSKYGLTSGRIIRT
jgi:hypothetical protein